MGWLIDQNSTGPSNVSADRPSSSIHWLDHPMCMTAHELFIDIVSCLSLSAMKCLLRVQQTLWHPLLPSGYSIMHPVPDWVKPSFVIVDIRALWRSCTHMATVRVRWLMVVFCLCMWSVHLELSEMSCYDIFMSSCYGQNVKNSWWF